MLQKLISVTTLQTQKLLHFYS